MARASARKTPVKRANSSAVSLKPFPSLFPRLFRFPLLRALLVILPVATATGAACAFFLWALEIVTRLQSDYSWLLLSLPLAGLLTAYLYERHGRGADKGNNLILEAIHTRTDENPDDDSSLVPRRMAPLILIATLLTHAAGGSAGREGTAVQMGGSLGATWARLLRLDGRGHRLALLCGIAAGFGGVFGTPLAGAVFALEVLWRGRIETEEAGACLLAALVGDWTSRGLGTVHSVYPTLVGDADSLDIFLAGKIALAAIAFGLAARAFSELTHGVGQLLKARLPNPLARPVVGGIIVVALTLIVQTRDYNGLSVPLLSRCFDGGPVSSWAWALKTIFTALTLGSGFKGGEVTPLFVIGAALGNALASPMHAPVALFAALGLVATFAGASKTPLASTFLGLELFGANHAPLFALACFVATWASGPRGIYEAQRVRDQR